MADTFEVVETTADYVSVTITRSDGSKLGQILRQLPGGSADEVLAAIKLAVSDALDRVDAPRPSRPDLSSLKGRAHNVDRKPKQNPPGPPNPTGPPGRP